jgi:hypothetical protein
MSRRSRKRYERIHTKRARSGFPPASKAILHKDGTVEERRPYRAVFSPRFREQLSHLSSSDQRQVLDAVRRLEENPYRGKRIAASWYQRLADWVNWLLHELHWRLHI